MLKPLLVYDSQCKVCCNQVENLRFLIGDRFEKESFREPNFQTKYPNIPLSECEKAVQFVDANGKRYSGAEAVARILAMRWYFYPLLGTYYIPGTRKLWDHFYAHIAKNRFN